MSKKKSLPSLVAISITVRLIPALLVFGLPDVRAWYRVAEDINAGRNPYLSGVLNWPPLWPVIVGLMASVARISHLPFYAVIKVPAIAADTIIAVLIYSWFERQYSPDDPTVFWHALWYVLNPVSIYTTSIMGQFDAIAVMFSLLSFIASEKVRHASGASMRSALFLGLGTFTKTWPVFFLPLMLRKAHVSKRWFAFVSLTLGPAFVGLAILYYFAPYEIKHYVLLYRSAEGWWGLSPPTGYLNYLSPKGIRLFRKGEMYLFYLAMLSAWRLTWRDGTLARSMCFVLLTFYVFTPGFGAQYLVWILPFALISNEMNFRIYTILASVIFLMFECVAIYYHVLAIAFPSAQSTLFLFAHVGTRAYLDRLPLWLFCLWWWKQELAFLCVRRPNLTESRKHGG